ncbi:unnamed protein product [Somion occarium]|uniref:Uncharacterized protein n=1 Tax=Somion occarium TaxID=3059160 RepID=A0ABP1DWR6_9APHY
MKKVPHLEISPPSFARPVTPGCPTDSGVEINQLAPWATQPSHDSIPPAPRSANALSRTSSLNSTNFNAPPGAQWRIPPGSYIAFGLDTLTVAAQFPEDSEAYEVISTFPTGKYVGCVVTSYTHTGQEWSDGCDDGPIEELAVHFVGATPPQEDEMADFWMPISPASDNETTTRGAPLKTKTLFPWKDKFQWTTAGTRLAVKTVHESSLKFILEDEEFGRLEEQMTHDYPALADTASERMPVDDDGEFENVRPSFERLKVPMYALPAVVWRDVREANRRDDPTKFLDEVEELNRLVCQYSTPEFEYTMSDDMTLVDDYMDTDVDE